MTEKSSSNSEGEVQNDIAVKKAKYIILIALCGVFSLSSAQVPPEGINYQAVSRDISGAPLSNQNIGVQFVIRGVSPFGIPVYTEQHSTNTNQFGLFNIEIGRGVSSDDFSAIAWGSATHWIDVQIDPDGGANYILMGTYELLSVPYALHAKTGLATKSRTFFLRPMLLAFFDKILVPFHRVFYIPVKNAVFSCYTRFLSIQKCRSLLFRLIQTYFDRPSLL